MFLIAFSCTGDDNEQKISSEGHVTLRQIIMINCANDQHYMYSVLDEKQHLYAHSGLSFANIWGQIWALFPMAKNIFFSQSIVKNSKTNYFFHLLNLH